MFTQSVRLIECPRDAMQGWPRMIPAQTKIAYLQSLLRVGFDTLDCGSFVSPKAIPQMADTALVLSQLDMSQTNTRLLVIVANARGASEACAQEKVSFLGYPFSVSETFQQRNTNAGIAESLNRVEEIQNLCVKSGKKLVVYISMGFGNPYGDPYSEDIVFEWVNKLVGMDIGIISLADTVGLATPEQVFDITHYLVDSLPDTEIGVHLHSSMGGRKDKVEAALKAGCLRFDGALKGVGGCPMANDELVGNMDTAWIIDYFESRSISPGISRDALQDSLRMAEEIFYT